MNQDLRKSTFIPPLYMRINVQCGNGLNFCYVPGNSLVAGCTTKHVKNNPLVGLGVQALTLYSTDSISNAGSFFE